MKKISGKEIATQILDELRKKPTPQKYLAVFVVGENSATESFMKQKEKIAKELGVDFRIYRYPETITSDKLRKEAHNIADAKRCGGAIIQLPLPEHINALYVANAIPTEKDIDLLGERMRGAFYNNRSNILPPSVETVRMILRGQNISEDGIKTVAVVGQGFLVGKPITHYFLQKVPKVVALDKGDDFDMLKEADLVISGAGVPGFIKGDMLKKGAGVIDFGYGTDAKGNVSGDVDVDSLKDVAFYTPTPGGTGPILVASLFKNFFIVNEEA